MKDPAFLFYPNDWIGGTMGWSFEQKGAYLELLMMQFNRGHMTSHMVGHVLGQNEVMLWSILKDKFELDEHGLYFNRRLEDEQNKRKAYADSRRNNLTGQNQHNKSINIDAHMNGHMTSHMENENINVNIDCKKGKKIKETRAKKIELTSEELFEKIKVHYRAEWITARDAKAAEEENPDKDINLIYDIKRAGETLTKVAKCIVDNELAFVASLDGQLTYKGIMTNPVLMDSELVIEKILGVEESDPVHKRYDKGGNPKLGLTVLRWIANDKKG